MAAGVKVSIAGDGFEPQDLHEVLGHILACPSHMFEPAICALIAGVFTDYIVDVARVSAMSTISSLVDSCGITGDRYELYSAIEEMTQDENHAMSIFNAVDQLFHDMVRGLIPHTNDMDINQLIYNPATTVVLIDYN